MSVKKLLPLLALSPFFLFAESEMQTLLNPKLQKEFSEASVAANKKKKPEAAGEMQREQVMIIDPKERAQDYKAAFDVLRQNREQAKITYFLTDKSSISGIISIDVLPGGTMLNFKLGTTKGVKYRIIPVEQIKSVGM